MIHLDGIIFSLQRYGGISVYFRELIKFLMTCDADFCLSIDLPIVQSLSALDEKIKIERRASRFFERYRNCVSLNSNIKPLVFHSSYYRKLNKTNIPSVVTVHDFVYERYYHGLKRSIHCQQKHAAIKSAQSIICISEATRNDLLNYVGETPGQDIHVIYNGVPASSAHPRNKRVLRT